MSNRGSNRQVVLGVTDAMSLILMAGLPGRLRDEGWDVHVVANGGVSLESLRAPGITPHAIPMTRHPSPWLDLRSLGRWVRLLRSVRPVAVFVGTPKAGLLGMLAARFVRVPVRIYHLRGLRLETVVGWRRYVFVMLERAAAACATSIVSVSNSLSARAVSLGLAPKNKVIVLGAGSSNGVDIDRFTPGPADDALIASLGLDRTLPVIGFVGRLTRDKGWPELIAASERLAKRGLQHQLLVVGPVEDASADNELAGITSATGVHLVRTGAVPDTAPYYRLMTVFCLPTLREGFPNAVLEASASGVATVTTDATGAIDSVVHGDTGLICRAGSGDSLADALETVITDAASRERMASAARRQVEDFYARDVVQTDVVQFLNSAAIRGQNWPPA